MAAAYGKMEEDRTSSRSYEKSTDDKKSNKGDNFPKKYCIFSFFLYVRIPSDHQSVV